MKLFNTSDEFAIIIGLIPFLHDSSHTKLKIQIDRYTDSEFSEYMEIYKILDVFIIHFYLEKLNVKFEF